MIAVIDYGLGNLRSVSKALEIVGAKVLTTNDSKKISKAKAIVLPGVGAFYRGIQNLERLGISSSLMDAIREGKPFLGICLGLQLLFTESYEHGVYKGLGIIKGKVKRFSNNLKVPHMGWNQVNQESKSKRVKEPKPDLFNNIPNGSYFYFVHSYYVEPEDKKIITGTTQYGDAFVSAINRDNVWGVQFHPEKSSKLGLEILRNFCSYAK